MCFFPLLQSAPINLGFVGDDLEKFWNNWLQTAPLWTADICYEGLEPASTDSESVSVICSLEEARNITVDSIHVSGHMLQVYLHALVSQ